MRNGIGAYLAGILEGRRDMVDGGEDSGAYGRGLARPLSNMNFRLKWRF